MLRTADSHFLRALSALVLLTAVGCNDAGTSTELANGQSERQSSLPLMSVGEVPARPVTNFVADEPTVAEPTDAAPRQGEPGNPDPTPAAGNGERGITRAEADLAQALQLWEKTRDASLDEAARNQTLHQIVDRASRAMALTRGQADEVNVFNGAAVVRANARMQLALIADEHAVSDQADSAISEADILAREADELFRYDATSMAAAETAYRVVDLARELAERHADSGDATWTQSYARQSRLFGQRFPQESHRAPLALAIAGQMCERASLMDEARQCYTALTTAFGDSLAAVEADRALRRINLVGQPLIGFAGETIDGEWLDVSELKGHTVVIVFFKSDSPEFLRQYEQLVAWKEAHGDNLQVVGVNLDADAAQAHDFVESHDFPGHVLLPSDPLLQGDNHPLAIQFAARAVPAYWLVSSEGIVLAAPMNFEALNETLSRPIE